MSYITIDSFIEAFAAELVRRGERTVRLNDHATRDNLLSVYEYLNSKIADESSRPAADASRIAALVNIRNIFSPSPIGAFDNFEAILRAKQDSLTEHPNPYYHDIVLRLSLGSAKRIEKRLPRAVADLAKAAAARFSQAELER